MNKNKTPTHRQKISPTGSFIPLFPHSGSRSAITQCLLLLCGNGIPSYPIRPTLSISQFSMFQTQQYRVCVLQFVICMASNSVITYNQLSEFIFLFFSFFFPIQILPTQRPCAQFPFIGAPTLRSLDVETKKKNKNKRKQCCLSPLQHFTNLCAAFHIPWRV